MLYSRVFVVFRIVVFLAVGVREGVSSEEHRRYRDITEGGSHIVLGQVISVTYKEDRSPMTITKERDWLRYEVALLPIHVFRGDILSAEEALRKKKDTEITIKFFDQSPLGITTGSGVRFRPHVGEFYIVFLNKTNDSIYELRDHNLGILPVSLMSLEKKEIWETLVDTIRNERVSIKLHNELFDCLYNINIPPNLRKELVQANLDYYTHCRIIIDEKLIKAKSLMSTVNKITNEEKDNQSSVNVLDELGDE